MRHRSPDGSRSRHFPVDVWSSAASGPPVVSRTPPGDPDLIAPLRYAAGTTLALTTLLAAPAPGQTAAAPALVEAVDQPWRITDFLDDAGLRGRFVLHMDFDADGVAWIASADGLHAYDGYRWHRYSTADGLPSDFVRCVLAARDGTLWVGTDRGVARYDGRVFRPLDDVGTREAGLAGPNVRRIVEDPDGALWFCCDTWLRPEVTAGLSRYHDGAWTTYRTPDGLPTDYVMNYFLDSAGRRFVLTRHGLAEWDGTRWRRPLETLGLPRSRGRFWRMIEWPAVGVIAGTDDGFFILKDGAWSHRPHAGSQGLSKTMLAAADGVLAIGWDGGRRFASWDGSRVEPRSSVVEGTGLAEYTLRGPDGSVWCVGYDLLMRWEPSGGEVTSFAVPARPAAAADGAVWFVDEAGALRHDGERLERVAGLPAPVSFDPDGTAWSWSRERVARHADGVTTVWPAAETGLAEPRLRLVDRRGDVWFHGLDAGAETALTRLVGNGWMPVGGGALDGLWIVAWAAEPDGGVRLLVDDARNRRLLRARGESIEEIGAVPHDVIGRGLHVDAAGGTWIYGELGLFRDEGETWQRIADLPGRSVIEVVEHGDALWFVYYGITGGRRGVSRLAGGAWTHFDVDEPRLAGRSARGELVFAGTGVLYRTDPRMADGLATLHLPPREKVVAAANGGADGLWIAMADHLLRYRPDGVPPETEADVVSGELIDGERLRLEVRGIERGKPRRLARCTFSWRYGDGAWTPFGALPADGLPAPAELGTHVLHIRARDEGGDVDPTPTRVTFRVLPVPIQSRAWFMPVVLGIAVVVALLASVTAFSRRRIRRYATTLEDMVDVRTADLRRSETKLRAALENIRQDEQRRRRMMDELNHRVKNNLAAVLSLVDLTNTSSSSREEFVDRFCGRIRSLAVANEALAATNWRGVHLDELLRVTLEPCAPGDASRISLEGPPVVLPARASGPVSMCVHELGTNAMRHGALSRADGRVSVRWRIEEADTLVLDWSERHDASVRAPERRGMGLGLIEGFIEHELRGSVAFGFETPGLVCTMRLPLAELAESGGDEIDRGAPLPAPSLTGSESR
jgi:two-component sensor histidine kinase